MAGFVQVWGSQQLELGASGCPDFHGTTGPNTHAVIVSNDSECTLDFKSDVDPLLIIPPRTALTIPCDVNMQYVISVDAASVATKTTNQLVILSENSDQLAYSSTPLPAPNLIQFVETIFGNANVAVPPQFTAIIVVPVNTTSGLTIAGIDSGFIYYNNPLTVPITVQLFPGLDPTGLQFGVDGGAQLNIYGLTIPLSEIGTTSPVQSTIVAPLISSVNDGVAGSYSIPTLAQLYGFNGASWDRLQVDAAKRLQVRPSVDTIVTYLDGALSVGINTGAVIVNTGGFKGLWVGMRVNSLAGGTVTLQVVERFVTNDGDGPVILQSTAISATGHPTALYIYPGLAPIANLVANAVLPTLWRPRAVLSAGTADITLAYGVLA